MGLTEKEAKNRLKLNGRNELDEGRRAGAVMIFFSQFKDVMVLILLGATVISALLGEITDAVTIILIVLLNAILGFIQEYRTEHTLEALRSMTSPTAKCLRDGQPRVIDAAELVVDDVVLLEAGDRVPADCVLLESSGFFTDESVLTGESEPVGKLVGDTFSNDNSIGKPNVIYSGTAAVRGRCTARVIAVGKCTQMGKISEMLTGIGREMTPLQKRLAELGKVVAVICVVVCMAVSAAGILRGEDVFAMLMTGITIAIAAIPEGLPATVTIALALAVSRMMKQNALVNRLHSVETLGCTSVICTDKTGTITENKMTVTEIFSGGEVYNFPVSGGLVSVGDESTPASVAADRSLAETLRCGVICSTAEFSRSQNAIPKGIKREGSEWNLSGDPTETALLAASAKFGEMPDEVRDKCRKIAEFPFDSEHMYMAVHCIVSGVRRTYFKGAEEAILPRCTHFMRRDGRIEPLSPSLRSQLSERSAAMSEGALRVLALACCDSEIFEPKSEKLVFLGFSGMLDPPREAAKAAVRRCAAASVRTVMITGDHKKTAAAIARKSGILRGGRVMTGVELDCLTDEELDREITDISVFARVEPAHKLRIVRSFRRRGEIVTMTGDGVNDAPAVKEADVGVAMGLTGTDVTKQAADVILLDDNLGTLVGAVEQGRCVYANIRKFVRYLLSCNIGEVLTMFLGILFGMPIILLPVQLLLVNLVTDGLPAIALGLEPPEPELMSRPPRSSTEGVFAGGLMTKIVFRGVLIGLSTLASFSAVLRLGGSLEAGRTAALITLVISQLIHVFECRSETHSLLKMNPFGNMKLVMAVIVSLAILVISVYLPQLQVVFGTVTLTAEQLLSALGLSVAVPLLSVIFW